MSSQRPDIVPEGFLEHWDAETVEEALQKAQSARSSTPESERKRCPHCESVDITPKAEHIASSRREYGDWSCHSCRSHFEEPLPPLAEIDEEEADR